MRKNADRKKAEKKAKDALDPLDRAAAGDESALPEVREMFRAVPRLVDDYGNLARQAERSWANTALGDNLAGKEGVHWYLDKMKKDLGGKSPSPLEQLLIERIAVCWLHLQYAETIYVQQMGNMSLQWAEFCQKRIDRAQKRFLSAIKTLALVRRLQLPAIQVNIGDKQMNIVNPNNQLPEGRQDQDESR